MPYAFLLGKSEASKRNQRRRTGYTEHSSLALKQSLVSKTCSCRYWQLSVLPCCHAISCILFKANRLDEYVADCYSVHHFNQTYSHCLNPVEGMNSWPASDREPLRAPGYVKMPGRPKTERRREPTEVRKATKMSKLEQLLDAANAACLDTTSQHVRT